MQTEDMKYGMAHKIIFEENVNKLYVIYMIQYAIEADQC
jgi:hypothetical protein